MAPLGVPVWANTSIDTIVCWQLCKANVALFLWDVVFWLHVTLSLPIMFGGRHVPTLSVLLCGVTIFVDHV
mgnify:CR=1 FL=1